MSRATYFSPFDEERAAAFFAFSMAAAMISSVFRPNFRVLAPKVLVQTMFEPASKIAFVYVHHIVGVRKAPKLGKLAGCKSSLLKKGAAAAVEI